jgi:hypothetical protein
VTRDELIEKVAQQIDPVAWSSVEPIDFEARGASKWEALMALAAIESAGFGIVPRDATYLQLTAADICQSTRKADIYRAMVEKGRVK